MLVNVWNIVNKWNQAFCQGNQVDANFQNDTVRLGYLGGTMLVEFIGLSVGEDACWRQNSKNSLIMTLLLFTFPCSKGSSCDSTEEKWKKLININKTCERFCSATVFKAYSEDSFSFVQGCKLVDNENIHVCPFLGVNFHWWFTRLCCTTH